MISTLSYQLNLVVNQNNSLLFVQFYIYREGSSYSILFSLVIFI